MRYFLTSRQPPGSRILLVESGARHLLEHVMPHIRATWGEDVQVDLVTCYAGLPAGLPPETTRVYRVTDYRGRAGRKLLYRELAANGYSIFGMICSNEPLMTKWKWVLAARIPAKVFVVNENADYFWVDSANSATIRHFVLFRAGLAGAGAVRTLSRFFLFPFTLLYLLLYATTVHFRRVLRGGNS